MNDWKTVKPDALYPSEALQRARVACSTAETARDRLKSAMRSHLATLDPVAHARHNEAQRGDAGVVVLDYESGRSWVDTKLTPPRLAPRATRSEEAVEDLVAKVRWAINELDGQGARSERIRNRLMLAVAVFEEQR